MTKQFPVLVYKNQGPHQRAGGTYNHKLVEDETEFDAALTDGWFPSLPEAIEGKLDAQEVMQEPSKDADLGQGQGSDDNMPPTRPELEAKATELGIKFNDKTSDKKLGDLIKATLES
jgi:hypothetical protein